MRNRQIAFEVDSDKYRFYIKKLQEWELLSDNEMLRERSFRRNPLDIVIESSPSQSKLPVRIIFGRETVDRPFQLVLSYGNAKVTVLADGIGHFSIE